MTTRIEILDGPAEGAARVLARNASLRIASSPPEDGGPAWVLPASAEGRDGAALVRGEGKRVLVVCEGGDVRVGAAPLTVGEEVALTAGDRFGVGGHQLRLRASAPDPAGASVSSILADVTPGGEAATGVLPGRTGEDWLTGLTGRMAAAPPPSEAASPAGGRFGAPSSGAVLPDDWLSEPARDDAGASDRVEQVAADRVPVDLSSSPPARAGRAAGNGLGQAAKDLARAAGVRGAAADVAPETQIANAGAALRELIGAIRAIERSCDALLADLEVSDPARPVTAPPVLEAAAILGDRNGQVAMSLASRIEGIRRVHDVVLEAIVAQFDAAQAALDPVSVEAETDRRGGLLAMISPPRARWRTYLSRWTPEDGPAPLSRDALRAILRARLAGDALPEPEDPS